MTTTAIWLLGAVTAGWVVQLWLSYRQSMAFTADIRALRAFGTVSVGVGGRRYRGGRAYVAVAVDERGVVAAASTLTGFTTFARGRPLPVLFGLKANRLRGEAEIPGLSRPQREAARQAAELLKTGTSTTGEVVASA